MPAEGDRPRHRWDRQTQPEDFEARERELADLRKMATTTVDDRPGLKRPRIARGTQ